MDSDAKSAAESQSAESESVAESNVDWDNPVFEFGSDLDSLIFFFDVVDPGDDGGLLLCPGCVASAIFLLAALYVWSKSFLALRIFDVTPCFIPANFFLTEPMKFSSCATSSELGCLWHWHFGQYVLHLSVCFCLTKAFCRGIYALKIVSSQLGASYIYYKHGIVVGGKNDADDEILRKRIAAGTATFLVKVKAHRGEPANEGANILADVDDCFYYHSWRNNVIIAFGTLSSFLT